MNKIVKTLIVSLFLLLCCNYGMQAEAARRVTLCKDKPFAEQLTEENTVYCIKSDYDLRGQKVTIPKGSTLKFKKGTLSNGELEGQGTKIITSKQTRFGKNLTIKGTWDVENAYSEWFGCRPDGTDNTEELTAFFNFPSAIKTLKKGDYGVYELYCSSLKNTEVYAYGAKLQYLRKNPDISNTYLFVLSNSDGLLSSETQRQGFLHIYGLTIDGNSDNFKYESNPTEVTSIVTHHTLRLACLDEVLLKDCTFLNSFMTAVLLDVCDRTTLDNCSIINSGESQKYTPIGSYYTWEGVVLNDRVHTNNGWIEMPCEEFVVKNSYFKNIGGSFASANSRIFKCFNNTIEDNRGYAFELGFVYNNRLVDIHDNVFTRVGSSAINMSGYHLPDSTINTIIIRNNKFKDLCYDSERTKQGPKNFLMIYRNKKENSRGNLDVIIKNNEFEFAPGTSQGLVCSDSFLFEGNTCKGFSGGADRALFFCNNDNYIGSYIIRNNIIESNSGAVSIIRSPKYLEMSGNKVTTSLSPAIVYVQGDERMEKASFKIYDNEVDGVSAMVYVSSNTKELEIKNNKSGTITEAIIRPMSSVTVNCRFEGNSFKKVSRVEKNIKIIEDGN